MKNTRRNKSIAELEAIASGNLSHFDGDFVDFGGHPDADAEYNSYDGYGDDMVDFGGNQVTFNELQPSYERIYRVTITNANLTDEQFYLSGGLAIDKVDVIGSAVDGLPVADGAFNSIAGNALAMAGDPFDWAYFYNFVQKNPTRVLGFKVSSTVATQMETTIVLQRQVPWKTLQSRNIYLSSYQNENTFQDKQVTVNEIFQFDDQLSALFTVKASSTLQIQFLCGAVLNPAKALFKKAVKANTAQAMRAGYQNLVKKHRQLGASGGAGGAGLIGGGLAGAV